MNQRYTEFTNLSGYPPVVLIDFSRLRTNSPRILACETYANNYEHHKYAGKYKPVQSAMEHEGTFELTLPG